MKKLDYKDHCPKCGNSYFDIKYIKNNHLKETEIIVTEYMEITCTRCKFQDKRLPKDAK